MFLIIKPLINLDTAKGHKTQSSDTKGVNKDVEESMSIADYENIDGENVDNFKKNLGESLFY